MRAGLDLTACFGRWLGRVRASLRFSALLSSLLLGACGHVPSTSTREQPGPLSLGAYGREWRALETDNVTLYTDLGDLRAREQARTLERLLAAYEQAGWHPGERAPRKLNVVMFTRSDDFAPFARDGVEGYFVRELLEEPWIVLPAPRIDGTVSGLAALEHELSHHVIHGALRDQPAWFAEGIAAYFESAHFVSKESFVMGGAPVRRLAELSQHGFMSSRRLLTGDTREPGFYGNAWLLTHYLIAERAPDFARFHDLLRAGVACDHAFRRVFPELQGRSLERALAEYLRKGRFATRTVKVKPPGVTPRVRVLTRADRHALLAALLVQNSRAADPDAARALFALALSEDPEQGLARAYTDGQHEGLRSILTHGTLRQPSGSPKASTPRHP